MKKLSRATLPGSPGFPERMRRRDLLSLVLPNAGCRILGVLLLLSAVSAPAANFSFYATLRAGVPGNGDWEIGVGSTPSASTAVSQMSQPVGPNMWLNSAPQAFQIG